MPLVALAGENRLAAGDRVGDLDRAAGHAGEGFRHREGLRQEPLQARARSTIRGPRRPILHAEERDDVLQLTIMFDRAARVGRDRHMLLADDERIEQDRG